MKKKKHPIRSVRHIAVLLAVLLLSSCLATGQDLRTKSSPTRSDVPLSKSLVLSHAEYLDRVQAIWTAQMIAQATGVRFEHQVASVLKQTPPSVLHGHAAVDDDYYYEMVAIRAFEKYGIGIVGIKRAGPASIEAGNQTARYWPSPLQQALVDHWPTIQQRGVWSPRAGNAKPGWASGS